MDGKLVAIFALILSSSLFPALVSVPTRPQHLQSSPELCWQGKPVMVACFIWCVSVLYQCCIRTVSYLHITGLTGRPLRIFTVAPRGSSPPAGRLNTVVVISEACRELAGSWYVGSDPIRTVETLRQCNYLTLKILQAGHYGNIAGPLDQITSRTCRSV